MTDEKKRERAAIINAFYWRRWKRLLSYGLTITEAFEIHRRGKENRLDPEEWKRRMLELQAEWARKDAEEEKSSLQNASTHGIIGAGNPHTERFEEDTSKKAKWITIRGTPVPLDENNNLAGRIGRKINQTSNLNSRVRFNLQGTLYRTLRRYLVDV